MNETINNDVLEYISTRLDDNVRALEGALNRVIALSRLHKQSVSVALAQEALSAITVRKDPSAPMPEDVLQAVAHQFSTAVSEIKGARRVKNITLARHTAMYILHHNLHLGVTEIGYLLGHRDHSTVIHGIKRVTTLIPIQADLSSSISEIRNILGLIPH